MSNSSKHSKLSSMPSTSATLLALAIASGALASASLDGTSGVVGYTAPSTDGAPTQARTVPVTFFPAKGITCPNNPFTETGDTNLGGGTLVVGNEEYPVQIAEAARAAYTYAKENSDVDGFRVAFYEEKEP